MSMAGNEATRIAGRGLEPSARAALSGAIAPSTGQSTGHRATAQTTAQSTEAMLGSMTRGASLYQYEDQGPREGHDDAHATQSGSCCERLVMPDPALSSRPGIDRQHAVPAVTQ